MGIENIMYLALGFLAAALLSLTVMPAIWHRAVRLTKARIEAATPMSLSEFRADKDQLRAEFALSTRRLEKNLEALRARLADQLGDLNRKKMEVAQIKAERNRQIEITRELEERREALQGQILELERMGTDLAQKLRMRDRDFDELRQEMHTLKDGTKVDELSASAQRLARQIEQERERANYFEQQSASLVKRLQAAEAQTAEAQGAAAEMRRALSDLDDEKTRSGTELSDAEARIASAESRLAELLEQTHATLENEEGRSSQLLAEKLSLEEEMDRLRNKVADVENAVLSDWENERLEQSHMREQLNDIAGDVSRLVYAVDEEAPQTEQTLFDRIRKFAGEELDDTPPVPAPAATVGPRTASPRTALSQRMMALRDTRPPR